MYNPSRAAVLPSRAGRSRRSLGAPAPPERRSAVGALWAGGSGGDTLAGAGPPGGCAAATVEQPLGRQRLLPAVWVAVSNRDARLEFSKRTAARLSCDGPLRWRYVEFWGSYRSSTGIERSLSPKMCRGIKKSCGPVSTFSVVPVASLRRASVGGSREAPWMHVGTESLRLHCWAERPGLGPWSGGSVRRFVRISSPPSLPECLRRTPGTSPLRTTP